MPTSTIPRPDLGDLRHRAVSLRMAITIVTVVLLATCTLGCGSDGGSGSDHLTAAAAVRKARGALSGDGWMVFSVSNTGNALGAISTDVDDPLTKPSGEAGQWIVDLYRDQPTPITGPEGQAGLEYSIRRMLVTDEGARSGSPQRTVAVPSAFVPVPRPMVSRLGRSLRAATAEAGEPHRWAVSTFCPPSSGECRWLLDAVDDEGTTTARVETSAGGTVLSYEPA